MKIKPALCIVALEIDSRIVRLDRRATGEPYYKKTGSVRFRGKLTSADGAPPTQSKSFHPRESHKDLDLLHTFAMVLLTPDENKRMMELIKEIESRVEKEVQEQQAPT